MDVFCLKCKRKGEISNPDPVISSNRRMALQGIFSTCGTKVYTFRKNKESEYPHPRLGIPTEGPQGIEPSPPPHPPIHG